MSARTTIAAAASAAVATAAITLLAPAPAHATAWIPPTPLSDDAPGATRVEIEYLGGGKAVAAWVELDNAKPRVRTAMSLNGHWLAPQWVSPAGVAADLVFLDTNEQGAAVVAWPQLDGQGHTRLFGVRNVNTYSWSQPLALSAAGVDVADNSVNPVDVGVAADGTVLVAASMDDAGARYLGMTTWAPGQAPGAQATLATDASAPALDVAPDGRALLAYTSTQPNAHVEARYRNGGTWSSWYSLNSPDALAGDLADVAINDAGNGTVVWVASDGDDGRVRSVSVTAGGTYGTPAWVSPNGVEATFPEVDINSAGTSLVAWKHGGTTFGYGTRPQAGSWTVNAFPAIGGPAGVPEVAIGADGAQVVTGIVNEHLMTYSRTNPVTLFATRNQVGYSWADVAIDEDNPLVVAMKMGAQNGWAHPEANVLDATTPDVTFFGPLPAVTLATSVPVAWGAQDDRSEISSVTVVGRSSRWNQAGFGEATVIGSSAASPTMVDLAPGTTYCLSGQARDSANNLSTWSEETCTTLPLDDVALNGGATWKRVTQKGNYLSTVTRTKTKGAVLVRKGVRARSLALVIARSATGGKVVVSFGGEVLKTVGFKGTGRKKVVPLAAFDEVRSGKVTIKVVSSTGRLVQVDGLVVAK